MNIQIISKNKQGQGQFNGGQIIENKPIGFPQDGGDGRPYSNLFYWAYAEALTESTIGLHPHQGFEIMSFVLRGTIRHYDTKLQTWQPLEKGDAQIIRAGNGISHAEHMAKGAVMFQIWLDPDLNKTLEQEASYSDYKSGDFPTQKKGELNIKTYIGNGSPFQLDTPGVRIEEWRFEGTETVSLDSSMIYSIYVLEGELTLNGAPINQDGFAIISDAEALALASEGSGKLFVISSPQKLEYKTYAEIMQERMAKH